MPCAGCQKRAKQLAKWAEKRKLNRLARAAYKHSDWLASKRSDSSTPTVDAGTAAGSSSNDAAQPVDPVFDRVRNQRERRGK